MSLPVTLCGTPGPGLCFLPLETPDIEPEEFSTFQSVGDPVDKNVEGELAGTGAPRAEACGGKEPRAPDKQLESSGGCGRMPLPGRG